RDVRRFDIAMNDLHLVRVFETGANLTAEFDDLLSRQNALFHHQRLDGLSFQVLHRDVEKAVDFAGVVDGDDIRVIHQAGGASFVLEAAEHFLVLHAMHVNAHGLERDRAADVGIHRAVHESHRTAPQLTHDFVTSDLLYRRHHTFVLTDECADLGGASSLMQLTDNSWASGGVLPKKGSPEPQLTAASTEIQWNQQSGRLPMCRKLMMITVIGGRVRNPRLRYGARAKKLKFAETVKFAGNF